MLKSSSGSLVENEGERREFQDRQESEHFIGRLRKRRRTTMSYSALLTKGRIG